MRRIFIMAICLTIFLSNLALATEKFVFQDWTAELGVKTSEAYTIADPNTSLGLFCASEQCMFYLRQGLNCTPGARYSVLMNSPSISTALTMECTLINGNLFQILTPFNAVLQAIQVGEGIGFAVALQSGAFAVSRFSLLGAKLAVDRVLTEAAASKPKEQRPAPQIVVPLMPLLPQIQIIPNPAPATPPKQAPKRSPNQPLNQSQGDIST